MERIMKVAALTACVGAVLGIAGCGNRDAEKGAAGVTKATTQNQQIKDVASKQVSLSPAEEMISIARKINAELAKHGVDPLVKEEEFSDLKKEADAIKELPAEWAQMKSALSSFLVYSSVMKEVNDLSKKMGGPYHDKEEAKKDLMDFLLKPRERQLEEIAEVQDLLKRLKSAKD